MKVRTRISLLALALIMVLLVAAPAMAEEPDYLATVTQEELDVLVEAGTLTKMYADLGGINFFGIRYTGGIPYPGSHFFSSGTPFYVELPADEDGLVVAYYLIMVEAADGTMVWKVVGAGFIPLKDLTDETPSTPEGGPVTVYGDYPGYP